MPSQYRIKNKRTETFRPNTQILASATSSNRPLAMTKPSRTTPSLSLAYLSEDKLAMCANSKRSKLILLFFPLCNKCCSSRWTPCVFFFYPSVYFSSVMIAHHFPLHGLFVFSAFLTTTFPPRLETTSKLCNAERRSRGVRCCLVSKWVE